MSEDAAYGQAIDTIVEAIERTLRAAKAQAWEEGVRCAIQNSCEAQGHVLERNPYREGGGE